MDLTLMPKIKELYNNGGNIIAFLKSQDDRKVNNIEDIIISYDFQSGSYIKFVEENADVFNAYTQALASILHKLGPCQSILEAGVGEATTLHGVISKLNRSDLKVMGFDISWSRIHYGRNFIAAGGMSADLFIADLFNIPLADSSVDIVYTSHALEPNGGREKEALQELYRVARRYVVLLEPTNEFADEAGKKRMLSNGYIQDLQKVIQNLGYDLITYEPFPVSTNPLNPTGAYVIKKSEPVEMESEAISFHCPISKSALKEFNDHYFSADSLVSYPKIMGIPCLWTKYGILTSKHES